MTNFSFELKNIYWVEKTIPKMVEILLKKQLKNDCHSQSIDAQTFRF